MKKIITKPKKENTFSPSKYANEEEKQIPPHPTPQIPGISPPTPSGGHSRNNPAGIAQKSKRIFKKKMRLIHLNWIQLSFMEIRKWRRILGSPWSGLLFMKESRKESQIPLLVLGGGWVGGWVEDSGRNLWNFKWNDERWSHSSWKMENSFNEFIRFDGQQQHQVGTVLPDRKKWPQHVGKFLKMPKNPKESQRYPSIYNTIGKKWPENPQKNPKKYRKNVKSPEHPKRIPLNHPKS